MFLSHLPPVCCSFLLLFSSSHRSGLVCSLLDIHLPRPGHTQPSSSQGPAQINRLRTLKISPRGNLDTSGAPDTGISLATAWTVGEGTPVIPPGALQAEGGTRMADSTSSVPPRPVKTLQKQWLEVLGAMHYVLAFVVLGPFSIVLLLFLLFTRLWSLSVFYMLWIYLDRDTPSQGGRRCEWTRHWRIWKYQRDYFPIKLVKTAELSPSQNYVLGAHPHGIMSTAPFCNFLTECNDFSQRFPGLQPWVATLAGIFYVPVFRDYIMLSGLRPASRHSLDFVLSQPQRGQVVVIVIGGVQESLYTAPGRHCLELLNRKGFVRLALRHGAPLVPVYSFGENDSFKSKTFAKGSWQYLCQVTYKKVTGLPLCFCWGRGLFSPNSWGLLPLPMPITTVVGGPIPVPQCSSPSEEQVDHYHRLYMDALERLFEEHKQSCGVPASTHLTFL
ncbi:2-acylglycerol O-acyltransferase 3 isoform X1 [Oryctolagus cuniculus]|uniref:2-acylglycerol O-acyltransferase 3 isoform X1 n=2 Tax=Oryctolagus cuniculus TaxID=9986 RepID=UPI003879E6C0